MHDEKRFGKMLGPFCRYPGFFWGGQQKKLQRISLDSVKRPQPGDSIRDRTNDPLFGGHLHDQQK